MKKLDEYFKLNRDNKLGNSFAGFPKIISNKES